MRDVQLGSYKITSGSRASLPPTGAIAAQRIGRNGSSRRLLTQKDPIAWARALTAEEYVVLDRRILHRWRGQFYLWNGARYEPHDTEIIKASAWRFLETSFTRGESKEDETGLNRFKPNRGAVSDLIEALGAVCSLSGVTASPAWIDGESPFPPDEILVATNGLLHLPTGRLLPASPAFFTLNATDIAYDTDAPSPAAWLAFLETIFTRDDGAVDYEAIEAVQDWFGYCLLPNTSQQKIMLLVGPPRSGKGTLMAILKEVIGRNNVVAPTLDGLAGNFGLEPLIDKTLAMIGDARLSGRADQAPIVENLLSISGEDTRTVARKFLPAWTGQLRTRFFISTNLVPRLSDSSGALAKRFIVVTLDQTFLGREDLDLKVRLLAELPGILNWARDGYLRLRERRRFVQPKSSQEAIDDLETLGSPMTAFLKERCEVGAGFETEVDRFFTAWKGWCEGQGRREAGSKASLSRDLKSVLPTVKTVQHRSGGNVDRYYAGVRLRWSVD